MNQPNQGGNQDKRRGSQQPQRSDQGKGGQKDQGRSDQGKKDQDQQE